MFILKGKYLGSTPKVNPEDKSEYRIFDVLSVTKDKGFTVEKVKVTDPKYSLKQDTEVEIPIIPFVWKTDSGQVGVTYKLATV